MTISLIKKTNIIVSIKVFSLFYGCDSNTSLKHFIIQRYVAESVGGATTTTVNIPDQKLTSQRTDAMT